MLDQPNIDHQIKFLLSFETSLSQFRADILDFALQFRENSNRMELSPGERRLLLGEELLRVADFFLLTDRVIGADADRICDFLNRHNDSMRDLAASCEKGYSKGGISKRRLESAILPKATINHIAREIRREKRIVIEQSALQKILVRVMSLESSRQLLLVLSESGLIGRDDSRTVHYHACGVLERLYLDHLTRIAG